MRRPTAVTIFDENADVARLWEIWPQRRRARALALMGLYWMDTNPVEQADILQRLMNWFQIPAEDPSIQRARELMERVLQDQQRLDRIITDLTHNWRIERISPVTKNIIRIALVELRVDGLDPALVINEAVELAKAFAEDDAFRFIHGLLDRAKAYALDS